MGLFKKDASAQSGRGAVTIIAQGNRFRGEMSIVGKLHVDGLFEGRIQSLDTISVGRRGELRGEVQAREIHVSGLIEGEVHCDELVIENGGEVRGTLWCDELVIERKGSFVGERRLKKDSRPQPPSLETTGSRTAEEGRPAELAEMLGQMLSEHPSARR